MMLWVVSAAVLLITSAAAVIVGIDSYQYRQNQQLIEKFAPDKDKAPSKTLVVFFSRSGNTEIMARKITQLTGADILPLQSAHNQIGGAGYKPYKMPAIPMRILRLIKWI
ncbi:MULTISPECIES: hypothetical protein [unclassified Neisseria]|uniref:hypothetical protein n=1 Tax=unclassified Neisseria TaxID=2623750 RepID=UPI0014312B2A|nr:MULTISPECIES: hypothetical protein [unclassified Neisseria]MBF0803412.1 hypothetical protein [Neisseria sp. 19428wB4_WF04]